MDDNDTKSPAAAGRQQLLDGLRAQMAEVTARPARADGAAAPGSGAAARPRGFLTGTRAEHLRANPHKPWLAEYPLGADWLSAIPDRFVHGQHGFDLRLVHDLAGAGLYCYVPRSVTNRLDGTLTDAVRSAAPVIADWLNTLNERIPGPETHHRYLVRLWLIQLLNHNGAKGSDVAVDTLLRQLSPPPLTYNEAYPALADSVADQAAQALYRIVRKRHHDAVYDVMLRLSPQTGRSTLLECLAQFKDPRVVALAREAVHDPRMRQWAIRALGRAKAPGARTLVESFAKDSNYQVRNAVKIALKKLPQ